MNEEQLNIFEAALRDALKSEENPKPITFKEAWMKQMKNHRLPNLAEVAGSNARIVDRLTNQKSTNNMEDQNINQQVPDGTTDAVTHPFIITCYVMKTKQKNVVMQEPVINITARGGYMAAGHDGNGNKCVSMLSKEKALGAIEAGFATKGEGWIEE